ncbi:MAG: hypothetical protein ABWZ52_00415 [Acidimicrobiales bacterium]
MAGGSTTTRSPGRIARSILAVLFGIIGVVGVLASVVGVWAHQTVFDSQKVASAVDSALLNPEVNEALATFLSDQLVNAVPLEDLIADRVPAELEPFTPVLVGGVRNVVHEGMTRVLEDGRAREALTALVERAHEAVMRVLEGEGLRDGFTVEGKDIKVNLLPLLSRGLERLQDRGLLTSVDLPELTADGDPEEQIAQLEEAIDRDLPDDFGQLVVYSSDNVAESQAAVARAQDAFALFRRSIIALILLTVVSLGISAALSTNRRRAAIALALSVVAALAVGRVLVRTVVEEAPNLASKPGGRAALEELVTSLTEGLLRLVSVGLLIGAALALVAFVLGNDRAKRGLRGAASAGAGARGIVDENRDATVMVSVALALLVITLTGFSWLSLLVTAALLAVAGWAAWAPRPGQGAPEEGASEGDATDTSTEEPVG